MKKRQSSHNKYVQLMIVETVKKSQKKLKCLKIMEQNLFFRIKNGLKQIFKEINMKIMKKFKN